MSFPTTSMVRYFMPGKRVCFWGAPASSSHDAFERFTWQERLQQTGGNTGNLFIGHGLFSNFDADEKSYHPGFGVLSPEQFDEIYDCLVIPASNFINPALDLGEIYNYFSKTKCQIFCFGIGSQIIPGEDINLKEGTMRFLQLISERSGSIGVRGSFTANILWDMGIRNISLTGCPSLLNLTDQTINDLVSKKPSLEKIAVNYSNNVRRHSFSSDAMRTTENGLFNSMIKENSYYIVQNEAPEIRIIEISSGRLKGHSLHEPIKALQQVFEYDGDEAILQNYLSTRLRVFFSVPPWVGAMRTMTATIGTRFHGNIASLLGGVPGMVLVHDMRTWELAELIGIPHIVIDKPYKAEALLERLLDVSYDSFSRRMNILRSEWQNFGVRNSVQVL